MPNDLTIGLIDWELNSSPDETTGNGLNFAVTGDLVFDDNGAEFSHASGSHLLTIGPDNSLLDTGVASWEIWLEVTLGSLTSVDDRIRSLVTHYYGPGAAGWQLEYNWPDNEIPSLIWYLFSDDGPSTIVAWENPPLTRCIVRAYYDAAGLIYGLQVNNDTAQTVDGTGIIVTGIDETFLVGNTPSLTSENDGPIRRLRFYPVLSAVHDADDCTWLYNSGAGRTYAEILATGVVAPPVIAGPHYPSSYNNPSLTIDNVTSRLELKDTTISAPALLGRYPTDEGVGTPIRSVSMEEFSILSTNPTDILGDLDLALTQLGTEITSLQTALTNLSSAPASVSALTSNLDELKIEHLQALGLDLAFSMKTLTAALVKHVATGSLAVSRYPSGQHRGY